MNINKLDENIKNLKYPIIFICRIISYKDEIKDENLNIIIRLFLKHHSNKINYNLLFENEFNLFPLTNKYINTIFILLNKKLSLIEILKKWYIEYKNPLFWNLELDDQITYLIKKKEHFQSIYECSKVGAPFFLRLSPILNNPLYRDEMMFEIEKRLLMIIDIFDKDLFDLVSIKCISVSEFYLLSNEMVIKYLAEIYKNFILLLNNTIELFQSLKIISDNIQLIMNPSHINIISEEISSETEIEDINLFCY